MKIKIFFIILILSSLKITLSEARFDPHLIRGTDSLLKKDKLYLSPTHGLHFLRSRILENYRFFGNYGAKKEEFTCFDKTILGIELREINDCPQDYFSEFLQKFLTSPDFGNIDPNPLKSDIVNRLHPKSLGTLASWIDQVDPQLILQREHEDALVLTLVNSLMAIENPRLTWIEEFQELNKAKRKLETKLKKIQQNPTLSQADSSDLSRLKETLKEYSSRASHLHLKIDTSPECEQCIRTPDLKPLGHLAVRAVRETLLKPELYSKVMLIHTLYAFFFSKYETKIQLLELLKGLAPALNAKGSAVIQELASQDFALREEFLKAQYSRADFQTWVHPELAFTSFTIETEKTQDTGSPFDQTRTNTASLAQNMPTPVTTPPQELQIFSNFVYQFYQLQLPELVTFSSSSHSSLPKDQKYPDCGETAIRNFFNIYLYDATSHRFNPEKLELLQGKLHSGRRVNISPSLIKFYKKNTDPSLSFSQELRDEWSEHVISALPGVSYVQPSNSGRPTVEIENGLQNFIRTIDQLMFGEETIPINRASSLEELRSSALETLSLFSPRIGSCKLETDPDNRIGLDIIKNSNPGFNERLTCVLHHGAIFYLHISSDHFFIRIPSNQTLEQEPALPEPTRSASQQDKNRTLFSSPQTFSSISERKLNREEAKQFALNLPLLEKEGFNQFLKTLLEYNLQELIPMAKSGMIRFPRTPERTLNEIKIFQEILKIQPHSI